VSRLPPFVREHWARLGATLLLVALFFGNQGFRSLVRNWWQLRKLKSELATLETQESDEAERLKLVRSGDQSLERMARRELGYVKKGEIEYRFPPPDKK